MPWYHSEVVVVVADEVLDCVVREELLHLSEELRCQRLVGRDDQGGALNVRDHVRDGERLAAPGDAQEDLMLIALLDALDQGGDGCGLVAGRGELALELETTDGHRTRVPCRPRPLKPRLAVVGEARAQAGKTKRA
jgi:hypothetical protein